VDLRGSSFVDLAGNGLTAPKTTGKPGLGQGPQTILADQFSHSPAHGTGDGPQKMREKLQNGNFQR
jgi:hypothetical protein